MPRIRNDYNKILFFEKGAGTFEYENRSQHVESPALIRTTPMASHRIVDYPGQPTVIHGLCLTTGALQRFQEIAAAWRDLISIMPESEILPIRNGFHAQQYRRLLQEMLQEVDVRRTHADTMLVGLATVMLAVLLRNIAQDQQVEFSTATTPAIAETIEYINHHFTEPLTVAELAQQTGMAYRTFTQHFRRSTGMSAVAYINQLRVQYALQRLQSTGDVMSSAFSAGFGDLGHFYRVFRRNFGVSPHRYLEKHSAES